MFRWWRGCWRSPRGRAGIGLLCLLLLAMSANVLARRYLTLRFDVTADRRYTLSSETRDLLARLDEPVTLRLYYSSALGEARPDLARYARRVRLLLAVYVRAAHSKLQLRRLDPAPRSAAARRALACGLTAVPYGRDREPGFFGLVGTNSIDERQIIARFDPARDRRLGRELTGLIRALAFPNQPDGAALAEIREPGPSERVGGASPRAGRRPAAIAAIDIGAMPALVAAGALAIALRRRRRRSRMA